MYLHVGMLWLRCLDLCVFPGRWCCLNLKSVRMATMRLVWSAGVPGSLRCLDWREVDDSARCVFRPLRPAGVGMHGRYICSLLGSGCFVRFFQVWVNENAWGSVACWVFQVVHSGKVKWCVIRFQKSLGYVKKYEALIVKKITRLITIRTSTPNYQGSVYALMNSIKCTSKQAYVSMWEHQAGQVQKHQDYMVRISSVLSVVI